MDKKKINICFLIGSFKAGGAENLLLQTLQRLPLTKFQPIIAVFDKAGFLAEEFEKLNIKIVEFKKNGILSRMINIIRFSVFLKENEIDIIHIHLVGCYVFGLLCSILARVKARIIHWHNVYDPSRTPVWKVYIGSKMSSQIVAISEAVKKGNCRLYGIREGKVKVIYNAIDTRQIPSCSYRDALEGICIGSVGKLEYQKGFDTLIESFKIVNAAIPEAVLEIIGVGSKEMQLKEYTEKLGLVPKVRFLGALPNSGVLNRIRRWRVFVLASRWEGFGIVFLEAMAMERPIVATNVEAIPEVVSDGETGWLCAKNDVKGISEKILWFLRNESEAIKFGKRGRNRVDELFSLDVALKELCIVYEQNE